MRNRLLPCASGRAKSPVVDEPRHLYIDGYNVLYAWGWLKPARASTAALDAARSRLAEAVQPIHDVEAWHITIVFDGRGPGTTAQHDAAASSPGVSVLFAPAGKTADDVIEARVAASADPRRCTVATADALERETVAASGAGCLAPEELLAWCERARARASTGAARRLEKSRSDWGNKLPL